MELFQPDVPQDGLALAAFNAPMYINNNSMIKKSIWHPFDPFTWGQNAQVLNNTTTKRPVGGDSPLDAARAAWYLSCVPYISDSAVAPLATALSYATHLSRESQVAGALYQRLCRNAGNFKLSEIEDELGYRIEMIDICSDTGEKKRVDPYYSKQLHQSVHASILQHRGGCFYPLRHARHGSMSNGHKHVECDAACVF